MFCFTKPMLAGTLDDLAGLSYPLLATPKLDGIRCLKINGRAMTRSMKPIPNIHIRDMVERHLPDGADGEIICPGADFSATQSAVMSQGGVPAFHYYLFDVVGGGPYRERVSQLSDFADAASFIRPLLPLAVRSKVELLAFERESLAQGYEGVMLRRPDSPYKCGRSTVSEGYLLKFKRFNDAEAVVVGFAQMRDKDGVEKETLGALRVRDVATGRMFDLGTGFTAQQRREIWDDPQSCVGRFVRYTFQARGTKNLPRFPVFAGFRHTLDLRAS